MYIQPRPRPLVGCSYSDVTNSDSNRGKGRWCCPLTAVEMNGINRFMFSSRDGLVMSERAHKEVRQL